MSKIKVKIAILQLKIMLFMEKVRKEALKLAFAVVIAEIIGVIALFYGLKWGIYDYLQPKTVIIYNAQAKTEPKEVKNDNEELADFIWNKESGRGKNNYSKCEAQGKVNGIGYNIPGNGKYQCFNSHAEEMQVLIGYIIDHKAQGMSRLEILQHYTPSYKE